MPIESALLARSESKCELCAATENLSVYEVPSSPVTGADASVLLCANCSAQVAGADDALDVNHWRCLSDSMWTQIPAVQVMAYRMLNRLRAESWAQDALEMIYLEDDTKAWAEDGMPKAAEPGAVVHKDCNGVVLQSGDTVTLIKDLKVKGGGFTAKRGTAVRGISLVADVAEHIEGRVDGQHIVILTEFVKKN